MKKKMELLDVPHKELIRENETITLFSIFDFKGGAEELFPFLLGCKNANCDVVFENEGITVYADREKNDIAQDLMLSLYALIAKEPKVVTDYMNYMAKREENP